MKTYKYKKEVDSDKENKMTITGPGLLLYSLKEKENMKLTGVARDIIVPNDKKYW